MQCPKCAGKGTIYGAGHGYREGVENYPEEVCPHCEGRGQLGNAAEPVDPVQGIIDAGKSIIDTLFGGK